ncbi:hypothetical protein EH240_13040 [Mesorhizobium tamadayense]|uniref:Uncharacterized protein n=1 Tax=Mesorhizobium tamadayense TaxID=425306 RepID=A0A3P3FV91_9HYPH|nr:hypothetical protein [Mesorhizobium tamadayense]RRI02377.1 hypothetical protein EH240_13040 [Mesorhizobium tamadayense]
MDENDHQIDIAVASAGVTSPVYAPVDQSGELRQGEILSNVAQHIFDAESETVNTVFHPYAIIASQDCDLLQEFEKTSAGEERTLNSVLLYEAFPTDVIKPLLAPGSEYWKRVHQNTNDRYHCLEAAPAFVDLLGIGLPDLVIDFKKFFAVASADIAHQVRCFDPLQRRCRLEMPYREHFQSRLAFYLQRVALPYPHKILPVGK